MTLLLVVLVLVLVIGLLVSLLSVTMTLKGMRTEVFCYISVSEKPPLKNK